MNTIKKLYLWAEKIWFKIPEKTRFVLVGGFNTVFAYLLLNVLNYLFGEYLPYDKKIIANIALIIQYAITVNLSFVTMRYYVFQSHGRWQKEYVRALQVYFFIYATNAPIISTLMYFGWPLWSAQAVYLIFATITTFLLHKYYSFKNKNLSA
ncbi:MAG: GtrA family protein [Alphaproteobacteria bacterium]|nr:GtrA family protein [Alphaproteobacteria bacterium]